MWVAIIKTNSDRLGALKIDTRDKVEAEAAVSKALDSEKFARCLTLVHAIEFEWFRTQSPEILLME